MITQQVIIKCKCHQLLSDQCGAAFVQPSFTRKSQLMYIATDLLDTRMVAKVQLVGCIAGVNVYVSVCVCVCVCV